MSIGEKLYLAMAVSVFSGWGLWMFYLTWRYDRSRKGPEVILEHDEHPHIGMAHAD